MHYTIYRITNKLNGKTYTGMHKTDNLDDGYMGSGKLIKRAIAKHGIEKFEKEILYIFDNEKDMKNKEKEVVVIDETTYNLCPGGHGGFGYINKTIDRISLNREINKKRNYKDEQFRDKVSKSIKKLYENGKVVDWEWRGDWTGKKHKPESIEKMKISSKGKHDGEKNSQFGTRWINDGISNKKVKKEELDFWENKGYHRGRII